MTFIDASMYDQAAQDSVARRSLWVVAAVLSFLVAIGIVAFFCTRLGCIPWISASKKSWHSWISVLVIAAVGLGLFLLAELGRIDARPLWLRIQIL
jgi:cadmium resistance protein CadD (predicted permease)